MNNNFDITSKVYHYNQTFEQETKNEEKNQGISPHPSEEICTEENVKKIYSSAIVNKSPVEYQTKIEEKPSFKISPSPQLASSNSLISKKINVNNKNESQNKTSLKPNYYSPLTPYNIRISAAARNGDIDECKKIFIEIEEDGLFPNAYTCNPILSLFVNQNKKIEVLGFFEEMIQEGVKPNIATYNILIQFHTKKEDSDSVKAVKALVHDMKLADIKPDTITYNALMNFYIKRKDLKSARSLSQEMAKAGIKPSIVICNILLKFYVINDDPKGATAFLQEMVHLGIKPDIVTYNTLLQPHVIYEDLESATEFKQKMIQAGIQPDIVTYNTLMQLYFKIGDLKGARNLLQEMTQANIEPDEVTYNTFIDLLVKLEYIDEAKILFHANYKMNRFINENGLDVHYLSNGAAFIALIIFTESYWNNDPFILTTGKGKHSNHGLFAMRNFLVKKILNNLKHLKFHYKKGCGQMRISRARIKPGISNVQDCPQKEIVIKQHFSLDKIIQSNESRTESPKEETIQEEKNTTAIQDCLIEEQHDILEENESLTESSEEEISEEETNEDENPGDSCKCITM